MRLSDLIADLQDALDDGGDREVRLITQPGYPLVASISHVYQPEAEIPEGPCPDHGRPECDECIAIQTDPYVYIAEGSQIGYGTRTAWEGR